MESLTIQADYEQLAAIADRFAHHAEKSAATRADLSRQLNRLCGSWQGQGAHAFFREMESDLLPALSRLIVALDGGAAATREISRMMREAEVQAAALFRGGEPVPPAAPPPQGKEPGQAVEKSPPPHGSRRWAQDGLLREAGIDRRSYDPDKPYDFNREAIEQGYAYYQKLYLENPDFWWMGFAYSAVKNSIYPAFLMLEHMADTLETLEQKLEKLPPEKHIMARELAARAFERAMERLGLPPEIIEATAALLRGGITSADIRAVIQEFVRMQNDIFMDMGAAHYAYNEGGIELIRQMGKTVRWLQNWWRLSNSWTRGAARGTRRSWQRPHGSWRSGSKLCSFRKITTRLQEWVSRVGCYWTRCLRWLFPHFPVGRRSGTPFPVPASMTDCSAWSGSGERWMYGRR